MPDRQPHYLFTAVHQGPYRSIQPLEAALEPGRVTYLVSGVAQNERERLGLPYLDTPAVAREWGDLDNYFLAAQVTALIRSTSEDVAEDNVEKSATAAAHRMGVPVFVIEDFPGNYWPTQGEQPAALFVEDESLTHLHRARGVDPEVICVSGNPRYGQLQDLDRTARRTEFRQRLGLDGPAVLWAGQPDGDNSYQALRRLIDNFDGSGVTLLFRAHPRDGAYTSGKYGDLLTQTSMRVLDVSLDTNPLGLYCASDLVITQFSSAGVEASHLGVPALYVLFDDLGQEYLRAYKGYDVVPWCKDGCSFLIQRVEEIDAEMRQAIWDTPARQRVLDNFHRRFGAVNGTAPAIARRIQTTAATSLSQS